MALVKQLMIRAGADFSAMRREMGRARNDLEKFKIGIGRTMIGIGAALATLGAGIGLNSAINDAIKFEALMGTLSGTLGKSMADFIKWQNTVGDAMGFSKLETAEMANNYSLRLRSIAKDEQDLFNKTTALIKAAAVIRSKTGMSSIEISDRMRSAMNQEADGADELGVNVRVSAIQQSKAYKELANNAPWEELSEGIKKTILYHHILDSTTSNFGDKIAQNTSLLKGGFIAALGDARLALGQAFLPILNIALPLLTRLARAMETVFLQFSGLMRALFPKSNIAAGNEQTAVIESQADALSGVGDAYKKAGKEAKKAAGQVQGFDEVHIQADPTKDSGADDDAGGITGGGVGFGGVPDMGPLTDVSEKMQKMAANIKKAFADMAGEGNIKKLSDAYANMKSSFNDLTTAISNFVENPHVKKFGQWMAEALGSKFMNARISDMQILSGIFESWAGSIEMLDGLLSLDFNKFFGGFEKWGKGTSEAVEGFIRFFSPKLADEFGKFRESFGGAWKGMRDDIKKYGDPMKMEISDFGDYIKGTLSKKWSEIETGSAVSWEAIKIVLSTKWEEIKTKASEQWEGIRGVISGVWEVTKTEAGTKWEEIKTVITATWDATKATASTKWGEIKQVVSTKWEEIKTAIDWNAIKIILSTAWAIVKTTAATKWEEIKQTISNKWGEITNLDFSSLTAAFNGIWNDLALMTENTWKGIGQTIKGSVNSIIDTINQFITQVNGMEIKIPKVKVGSIEVGGGTIGMPNIPKIPRLAKGGITNGEMLATIGDNPGGQEVVSPLSDLLGMIQATVNAAMLAGNQNNNSNQKQPDIVLDVDGQTFARLTNAYAAKENTRIGGSMISVT